MLCARAGQRAPAGSLLRVWRGRGRGKVRGARKAARGARTCMQDTHLGVQSWLAGLGPLETHIGCCEAAHARAGGRHRGRARAPKKARATAHRRPHGGGEGVHRRQKHVGSVQRHPGTRVPPHHQGPGRACVSDFKMKFKPAFVGEDVSRNDWFLNERNIHLKPKHPRQSWRL